MQKTTLEQWRVFVAVAHAEGFNRAVPQINKSQSSIHHAVNRLEELLGLSLLTVSGKRVHLTDAGKVLLPRATALLEDIMRLEQTAQRLTDGVEPEIRIALDGAFPQTVVHKALESVSRNFPGTCIELIDTVLSGGNELVRLGEADVAVTPLRLNEGSDDELCVIDFVAVAAPRHPLFDLQRELTLNDLVPYRQIIVRDSSTTRAASAGWRGAEQRWTVSNLRASMELVLQTEAYAWLPLPMVESGLDAGSLTRLPLKVGGERAVPFYLGLPDIDWMGPATREFIGNLRLLTLSPSE